MPSKIFVFFEITIGTKSAGRIVFELFNDLAPKSVENFRGLCTGQYGNSCRTGLALSYRGCKFFRVVPGMLAQGGDIETNDGKGGESIYGTYFNDESFIRRHCYAGILSMANTGKNKNASQFIITLKKVPQLDGRNVVIGRVVEGMDIVRAIEKCPTDVDNVPRVPIVIVDCGQLHKPPNRATKQSINEMRDTIQTLMSTLEPQPDQQASDVPPKSSDTEITHLLNQKTQNEIGYDKVRDALLASKIKPDRIAEMVASHEVNQVSDTSEEEEEEEDLSESKLHISSGISKDCLEAIEKLKQQLKECEKLNAQEIQLEARATVDPRKFKDDDNNLDDEDTLKKEKPKKWKRAAKDGSWSLHETAQAIQYHDKLAKKKQKNIETSFGWNAFNIDASYRAHKKRTADIKLHNEEYAKQMLQLGKSFYDPTASLVSAEFQPTPEAKERLAEFVRKDKEKKKSFRRRRMYIEDETVQHINEFNRSFNKKLKRAYGAHALEIKQNLERGTAL